MNGPLRTLTLAAVLLPVAAFAQAPLWDPDPLPFEFSTFALYTPWDGLEPLLEFNVKQSNAQPGQYLGVDDGNDKHAPWQSAPACFATRDPGPFDVNWFRVDWTASKLVFRVGTQQGYTWTVTATPGLWAGEWDGTMRLKAVLNPCPGNTLDPRALPVRVAVFGLIDVGNNNYFERWPFAVP